MGSAKSTHQNETLEADSDEFQNQWKEIVNGRKEPRSEKR